MAEMRNENEQKAGFAKISFAILTYCLNFYNFCFQIERIKLQDKEN